MGYKYFFKILGLMGFMFSVSCSHFSLDLQKRVSPPQPNSSSRRLTAIDSSSTSEPRRQETQKIYTPFDLKPSILSAEKQARVDYLFLKSEVNKADQNSFLWLQEALKLDPHSSRLAQKLAIEYYRKGELQNCIYWLEKSVQLDPQNTESLVLLGTVFMSDKKISQAEATFFRVLKLKKDDPEALLYLGALAADKKNFTEAHKYFSKVIQLKSYEPEYLPFYYRARTIVELKKKSFYKTAIEDLKKALELKPDFIDGLLLYGLILDEQTHKLKSVELFADHQNQFGPFARLADILSQHYLETEQYNLALKQLQILDESQPDQINVKLKIALIHFENKNFKDSLVKLKELQVLVPESDKVQYYLGNVYEELRDVENALTQYNSIAVESSHFAESKTRAAFIFKSQNKFDQALSALEKVIQNKPDYLQSYFLTSQILEEKKDYKKAIEILNKALKFENKNPQLHYLLGALNDKVKNNEQFEFHMLQSIKLDQNFVLPLNYLAFTWAEQNKNLDQAEQFALKALSIAQDDPYIIDTVGWVYFKKGEYKKALAYLENAHKLAPQVSVILEHLGDLHLKLNQYELAKEAFQKAKQNENDTERSELIKNKIQSTENALLQMNKRTPANL